MNPLLMNVSFKQLQSRDWRNLNAKMKIDDKKHSNEMEWWRQSSDLCKKKFSQQKGICTNIFGENFQPIFFALKLWISAARTKKQIVAQIRALKSTSIWLLLHIKQIRRNFETHWRQKFLTWQNSGNFKGKTLLKHNRKNCI